ncbi:MAG: hypothetical protein IJU45_06260 [Clostridia bacterium]|nr:hypothetical protein [Clostridia bacterium]
MKIKEFVSVFITAALCVLTLCSCYGAGSDYPLTVGDIKISREVFNYYLAEAENDKANSSDSENSEQRAAELCRKFKAGNELIYKYGITLSPEEKVMASNKIKGIWQYYSQFYKSYSVSKQTVSKMVEYDMLIDNLTSSAVLTGLNSQKAEARAKSYFNKNYVAVSLIFSPFTDKKGNAIKESEQKKLTKRFTEMRNQVRQGSSMAFVAAKNPDIAEYDENKIEIICADDRGYPEGMFGTVAEMKNGAAQVYKFSDGIYLIRKLDIADKENNYFERYKKECILKLFGQNTEKAINTLAESYEIVYN